MDAFRLLKSQLSTISDPYDYFAQLACVLFRKEIISGVRPATQNNNYLKVYFEIGSHFLISSYCDVWHVNLCSITG